MEYLLPDGKSHALCCCKLQHYYYYYYYLFNWSIFSFTPCYEAKEDCLEIVGARTPNQHRQDTEGNYRTAYTIHCNSVFDVDS